MLKNKLIDLCDNEYLYDHPKIVDVLNHLLTKLVSPYMVAILFDVCLWMETFEDKSLIIVAQKFARMSDDLQSLVEEVKGNSL
jgi:hypothetical protein